MNLKDYREKELKWYILANVLIILFIQDLFQVNDIFNNSKNVEIILTLLGSTVLTVAFFCFILVTESLFSSNTKTIVLNLGIFRQPGEIIFSELKNRNYDIRFTKEQVFEKFKDIYNKLPEDKNDRYKYENSQWYSIFNKHRSHDMIMMSNREYLLCRDIYISNISLVIIYLIASFWLKIILFNYKYLIFLAIMLIITNIGTRQKAKRYAYNVIALEINDKKNKE